jgi:hypothetical protein
MNLVCFSNYTAGGLVCDLLNNKPNIVIIDRIVDNREHNVFKIGDNSHVYREFDEDRWLVQKTKLENKCIKNILDRDDIWVGSHCHPSCIPDQYLQDFDKIITITTQTEPSKFYRFLRAWQSRGLFYPEHPAEHYVQNVVEDFESFEKCVNIEFADIVEGRFVKDYNLNQENFDYWKSFNQILYTAVDQELVEIFHSIIKEDHGNY